MKCETRWWPWGIMIAAATMGAVAACGGDTTQPLVSEPIVKPTFLWEPPTTRVNGAKLGLGEIAGYKVYYSDQDSTVLRVLDVGIMTSHTVTALAPGTYHFNVTAYDTFLQESDPSITMTVTFN